LTARTRASGRARIEVSAVGAPGAEDTVRRSLRLR
jgi:hypothetical protein